MRFPFAFNRNTASLPLAEVPQNLVANNSGDMQIVLTWNAVAGATKYRVISPNSSIQATYNNILTNTVTINQYLTHGVSETFQVQSWNGYQWSASSNSVSAIPYAPPVVPTGLAFTQSGSSGGTLQLTWTAAAYATKYEVANFGSDRAPDVSSNVTATSWFLHTQAVNRYYYGAEVKVAVRSWNGRAWSAYSTVATFINTTTIALNTDTITYPNSLTDPAIEDDRISLIVSGNYGDHLVEYGTVNGGPYPNNVTVVSGTLGSVPQKIFSLTPNTTYYFKVTHVKTGINQTFNFTTKALFFAMTRTMNQTAARTGESSSSSGAYASISYGTTGMQLTLNTGGSNIAGQGIEYAADTSLGGPFTGVFTYNCFFDVTVNFDVISNNNIGIAASFAAGLTGYTVSAYGVGNGPATLSGVVGTGKSQSFVADGEPSGGTGPVFRFGIVKISPLSTDTGSAKLTSYSVAQKHFIV